jgi:phenylacetate-CoA ligase
MGLFDDGLSLGVSVVGRLSAIPFGPRGVFEELCERVYLPLVDARKQNRYAEAAREARRNQRLGRDALDALVLEKLRRIVRHAEDTCPFYGRRFRDAGVSTSDLRSAVDLARFPLVTKADVAEHGEEMNSRTYQGRIVRGVTSGSTGTALRFRQAAEHEGWIEACWERGVSWWGVRRGDRRIVLWGRPVHGGARAQAAAWLKHRMRNALSFDTFEELDDAFFRRICDALETFRPRLVYGYGSSLGALAEFMERAGRRLDEASRPRVVVYTGDHIYEAERETGERVFGAPIVSLYGSSEAGSVGYTCPHRTMHVSEDHIHVEFLREDGTPAEAGELAEIVVTTLNNFAMPLIRYRVGDLGSYSWKDCPCGVTLRAMNLEVGKVADRITTSSRSLVSPYSLDYINKHLLREGVRGIRQFLVEQVGRDDFVLHVVREEPFDPRCVEIFTEKMRDYLGESIRTKVRFTDAIPVSRSGKRRWFLDSTKSGSSVPSSANEGDRR